jgi:hypothetical protein
MAGAAGHAGDGAIPRTPTVLRQTGALLAKQWALQVRDSSGGGGGKSAPFEPSIGRAGPCAPLPPASFPSQRRAWLTNLILVAMPLAFNILLVILQMLVDSELSGRDYRCGCLCTSCCDWVEARNGAHAYAAWGSAEPLPAPPSTHMPPSAKGSVGHKRGLDSIPPSTCLALSQAQAPGCASTPPRTSPAAQQPSARQAKAI